MENNNTSPHPQPHGDHAPAQQPGLNGDGDAVHQDGLREADVNKPAIPMAGVQPGANHLQTPQRPQQSENEGHKTE